MRLTRRRLVKRWRAIPWPALGWRLIATIGRIIDEIFERTLGLLRERRDALERTARMLLEKETLGESEIRALASGGEHASAAGSAEKGQSENAGGITEWARRPPQ